MFLIRPIVVVPLPRGMLVHALDRRTNLVIHIMPCYLMVVVHRRLIRVANLREILRPGQTRERNSLVAVLVVICNFVFSEC